MAPPGSSCAADCVFEPPTAPQAKTKARPDYTAYAYAGAAAPLGGMSLGGMAMVGPGAPALQLCGDAGPIDAAAAAAGVPAAGAAALRAVRPTRGPCCH